MNTFFKYIVILSCITSISMHGMNIKNLQKIACAKQIPQKIKKNSKDKWLQWEENFSMSKEELAKKGISMAWEQLSKTHKDIPIASKINIDDISPSHIMHPDCLLEWSRNMAALMNDDTTH